MKANKYLISIILLFVLGGGIYFLIQNRIINFNETNCVSCNSSQDSAIQEVTPQKIKTVGEETFEEMLGFGAVATMEGPAARYFNWEPKNPCPGLESCYLKKIETKATFINTGDSSVFSSKGAGYIQIASSEEGNCSDPSQAEFKRYLAYSPVMSGGQSWTNYTCGENADLNTCELKKTDGFDDVNKCFSLKLFASSTEDGAANFATHLIYLKYSWAWGATNLNETQ
ncbi:MAG: hypothetical protein COS26_03190 [Candidatus Nealsonbacteria bacterium CG02_land_8_20_14_3_00_40_11]|uniref:Uncharacterized protein n=1 Tax=Candidatus Nealsonbacteria bacterium CG02_land_8_20_14_3_00_40_11 TaxID=1974700 RepID=A0A2M7D744_9BACT|nr:MAG: hypothetical protein COS26_03190 [Candidatus Nealsonbacteria bacterium CG02_land_8_20_14_3_00_40_11]